MENLGFFLFFILTNLFIYFRICFILSFPTLKFLSEVNYLIFWFCTSFPCSSHLVVVILTYYWTEDWWWDFEACSNSCNIRSWVGKAVFVTFYFLIRKQKLYCWQEWQTLFCPETIHFSFSTNLPLNFYFPLENLFSFLSLTIAFLLHVFLREKF